MDTESMLLTILGYAALVPGAVVTIVGAVIAYRRRLQHAWVSHVVIIACVGTLLLMVGSHFMWPALGNMVSPDMMGLVFSAVSFLMSCAYAALTGLLIWAALAGRRDP